MKLHIFPLIYCVRSSLIEKRIFIKMWMFFSRLEDDWEGFSENENNFSGETKEKKNFLRWNAKLKNSI